MILDTEKKEIKFDIENGLCSKSYRQTASNIALKKKDQNCMAQCNLNLYNERWGKRRQIKEHI